MRGIFSWEVSNHIEDSHKNQACRRILQQLLQIVHGVLWKKMNKLSSCYQKHIMRQARASTWFNAAWLFPHRCFSFPQVRWWVTPRLLWKMYIGASVQGPTSVHVFWPLMFWPLVALRYTLAEECWMSPMLSNFSNTDISTILSESEPFA